MKAEEFVDYLVSTLRQEVGKYTPPLINQIIDEYGHSPYLILISCLLSLRAKDTTTIHVCCDLFAHAQTPAQLLGLPRQKLEQLIFKSGYYRNKADVLQHVSRVIIEQHDGKVPDSMEELLAIKGIGRKTANLVMGMAYNTAGICVDTHVHRISNRFGLITTKTTDETEYALMKILPKKYWIDWNFLLVIWGQNVCVPISPKCSTCPLKSKCPRVGVLKSR